MTASFYRPIGVGNSQKPHWLNRPLHELLANSTRRPFKSLENERYAYAKAILRKSARIATEKELQEAGAESARVVQHKWIGAPK